MLSEGYTIYCGPPHNVETFFSTWGFKMPRFANPADKLSTLASEPWRDLKEKVTIVEIAQTVRVSQIEYIELSNDSRLEILDSLYTRFTEIGKSREVSFFS